MGSEPGHAPREWQRHLHGHQRGVPKVLLPSFGISHEAASPEARLPGHARTCSPTGGVCSRERASFGPSAVSHPLPAGTAGTTCTGTAPGFLPVASSLSSALPPLFPRAGSRGCLPAPGPASCPLCSQHSRFSQHLHPPRAPSRAPHNIPGFSSTIHPFQAPFPAPHSRTWLPGP